LIHPSARYRDLNSRDGSWHAAITASPRKEGKEEGREGGREGRRDGGETYLDRRLGRVQELELQRGLLASGNNGLPQLDCACSSLGPVVGHDGGKSTSSQGGGLREGMREGGREERMSVFVFGEGGREG